MTPVLSNLGYLCLAGLLAFGIACCFWNPKRWDKWSQWWNAEGIPIFMLVAVVVILVMGERGWLVKCD